MEAKEFWEWFESVASRLVHRESTFRKMFEHLDKYTHPVTIVETGCAREPDNWAGDGLSTVLFDKYVSGRGDGSKVMSVDISGAAVKACQSMVSSHVSVHLGDSVQYLDKLVTELNRSGESVELFYLDSFDLDWTHWYPSAIHHLKELVTIYAVLKKDTLLVVDDCMQTGHFLIGENQAQFLIKPSPGGKGKLVAEFAQQVGADLVFSEYQAGWTGFNKEKTRDPDQSEDHD